MTSLTRWKLAALAAAMLLTPMASTVACGKARSSRLVPGVYHEVSESDAENLEFRSDGTFVWTMNGCDTFGFQCGEWKQSLDGTITITPTGAVPRPFHWGEHVDVVAVGDGLVVRSVNASHKTITEKWKRGRVCAACDVGTGLGPGAPPRPCDEAMPKCPFRLTRDSD